MNSYPAWNKFSNYVNFRFFSLERFHFLLKKISVIMLTLLYNDPDLDAR